MNLLVPIVMIVASNVLYNLFTKTMPAGANPFAALVITYLTAGAVSFGMLLVTAQGDSAAAFRSINWTSAALGASIVGWSSAISTPTVRAGTSASVPSSPTLRSPSSCSLWGCSFSARSSPTTS